MQLEEEYVKNKSSVPFTEEEVIETWHWSDAIIIPKV
jgi:hypothetical protein